MTIILSVVIGALITFTCILFRNIVSTQREMESKIEFLLDEVEHLNITLKQPPLEDIPCIKVQVGLLRNQLEQCLENDWYNMASTIKAAISNKSDLDVVDVPEGMSITLNVKEGIYTARVTPD